VATARIFRRAPSLQSAPGRPKYRDGSCRPKPVKSASGWRREFDQPILLSDGRKLVILRDAAVYITAHPRKEADATEWQAAIEALMLVVELGGPTMMARIGIMRALNRHHVREFNPSRKEHHWGRRKLKRDQ
jgi:hypothetical protein